MVGLFQVLLSLIDDVVPVRRQKRAPVKIHLNETKCFIGPKVTETQRNATQRNETKNNGYHKSVVKKLHEREIVNTGQTSSSRKRGKDIRDKKKKANRLTC